MEPQFFFSVLLLALCVVIVGATAVVLNARYKQRELQHRERMAALERGAALPAIETPSKPVWRPTAYLLRGMMWLFAGLGLTMFLLAVSLSSSRQLSASDRVQRANWAKNAGASEEQVRLVVEDKEGRGLPPGFALIGLIPIGVGAAYLLTYRKENELRTAS